VRVSQQDRHSPALLLDDMKNRLSNTLVFPQPSPPAWSIAVELLQSSACVSPAIVHYFLGENARFDDDRRGYETPTTVAAGARE
jgi:hypothetical protein